MRHYTVNIPPSVGISDDAYEYTVDEAFGSGPKRSVVR